MLTDIKVIDTDSHVTEPPDLWTSRIPAKWGSEIPQVDKDPDGELRWRMGDHWATPIGYYALAGWKDTFPSMPETWEQMDPGAYDPVKRLERMDEYGIHAQVLFPNIVGFQASVFRAMDPELGLACISAYNDYLMEFAETDRGRLIPVAMLPVWDVEASVAELHRIAKLGYTATLFGGHLERVGLPPVYDEVYNPVWRAASDLGICVNFHIGFSQRDKAAVANKAEREADWDFYNWIKTTSTAFSANSSTLTDIIVGGVCERFPELDFISVESGFGYVPYLLEILDWQWLNSRGLELRPGWLLPSEYFKRQIYATFWFEKASLPLLTLYPDNVMFETDYPHPTSLSPGPASASPPPNEVIETNLADVDPDIRRKVLSETAARVYQVKVSAS